MAVQPVLQCDPQLGSRGHTDQWPWDLNRVTTLGESLHIYPRATRPLPVPRSPSRFEPERENAVAEPAGGTTVVIESDPRQGIEGCRWKHQGPKNEGGERSHSNTRMDDEAPLRNHTIVASCCDVFEKKLRCGSPLFRMQAV